MPTRKSRAPFLTVLPIGMITPAYTQCAIGLVPCNPLTVDTALAGFAFARLRVVLRIVKLSDSCYHCPFLYDDTKDAVGRHPGSQAEVRP
jgi:hypothetical protein